MARSERPGRGYPGGPDNPGAITSNKDPRFAEIVAAEQSGGLPRGVRRGYPGVVAGDRPAFDGTVNTSVRTVVPARRV